MKGVAFDFSGVLAVGSKALPRAKEALLLLKEHGIPYVILTNAGGRTDKERARFMNKALGDADLIS
jgi:ribonucleotide monophosphatase NagD (HAD superfamily)